MYKGIKNNDRLNVIYNFKETFINILRYKTGGKMLTIYDIAKITGFSPTTVSKVINNYPDVSDKTRKKIQKALVELEFQPNAQAQYLATKKTWTIGVVYYEGMGVGLAHSFFSNVIQSLKQRAEEYGYSLLFGSKTERLRNNTFLEYFKYARVDGIVIISTDEGDKETEEIVNSDFPSVIIDIKNKNAATVSSDNESGCKLAVDYLYELGHRKIAHISGGYGDVNWPSKTRSRYYEAAMNNLGLDVPEGYIADGINFDYSGGYTAMQNLLKLQDRPTAVFAAGDKLALGAIAAIRDAGMDVPKDFSVIGFDDIELARYVTPGLTTIRQNSKELGSAAADLLVEQINEKKKSTENKVIPVELVKRDSCRKIK